MQRQLCDARDDVQAGVALNAERLQVDACGRPADQSVGIKPHTDCRTCRHTAIMARKRTCTVVSGWSNNLPQENTRLLIADINAKLRD